MAWKQARWPPLFITFLTSPCTVITPYQISSEIYGGFYYPGITLMLSRFFCDMRLNLKFFLFVFSFSITTELFQQYFHHRRDSSIGRASDWRSEVPWFKFPNSSIKKQTVNSVNFTAWWLLSRYFLLFAWVTLFSFGLKILACKEIGEIF